MRKTTNQIVKANVFNIAFVSALVITSMSATTAFATHQIQESSCPPTAPENGEPKKQKVGEIKLTVLPIFDESLPEENNWLFRGANSLKVATRESEVKGYLLFDENDDYDPRLLEESERLLRGRKYLRDAHMLLSDPCAEVVDIEVQVKDVWTLLPDISFSSGGGDSSSRLGFRDSNFLGFGKSVLVVHKKDKERSGLLMAYGDPNVLGSRNQLDLQYQDNDDGQVKLFHFAHPFFSLNSKWSAGVFYQENVRDDTLYFRNEEVQQFAHDQITTHVYGGISSGLKNSEVNRYTLGYTEERSDFEPTIATSAWSPLPTDREFNYAWFSWHFLQDSFVKTRHVNQMSQTEDLNFGWNMRAQLGYGESLRSVDSELAVFRLDSSQYFRLSETLVSYFQLNGSTYYFDDDPQHQLLSLVWRLFYAPKEEQQWFLNMEATYGKNLFIDQPLNLGGDNGLRGYPTQYQVGDRRALVNLERRFYLFYDVWSLFDMGAAVFADYGRAWFEGRDNGANGDWLSDVGFGFRFSSTRTGSDTEGSSASLHVDFATPLVKKEDPLLDDWQILVQVKNRF